MEPSAAATSGAEGNREINAGIHRSNSGKTRWSGDIETAFHYSRKTSARAGARDSADTCARWGLNLLPFDALRAEDGQFLIKSREITYAPSGTILITLRRADRQQPTPRLALAVGDVVYENQGDASRRLPKPASLSARVERGSPTFLGSLFMIFHRRAKK